MMPNPKIDEDMHKLLAILGELRDPKLVPDSLKEQLIPTLQRINQRLLLSKDRIICPADHSCNACINRRMHGGCKTNSNQNKNGKMCKHDEREKTCHFTPNINNEMKACCEIPKETKQGRCQNCNVLCAGCVWKRDFGCQE